MHGNIYWPTEEGQTVVDMRVDHDAYDTGEKALHRVLTYLVADAWTDEDDIVSVARYESLPEADGVFDVIAYRLGDDGKEVAKVGEVLTEGGASKAEDITTHMDDMEDVVEAREDVHCEFICESMDVAREQVAEALVDGGYIEPSKNYQRASADEIGEVLFGKESAFDITTGTAHLG